MTTEEIKELLADVLEMEIEDINPEDKLSNLDEWDSIAILSFIAMVDDEFDQVIKGEVVRSQETVGDLIRLVEQYANA